MKIDVRPDGQLTLTEEGPFDKHFLRSMVFKNFRCYEETARHASDPHEIVLSEMKEEKNARESRRHGRMG